MQRTPDTNMSHFAVMVIGENVEQQLQPYHEFECTGTNDQFVQNIDITNDVQGDIDAGETLQDALSNYGLGERTVEDETHAETQGDDPAHKWGYAVVRDGKLIKAVDRTNPHKKWDWWQVGGRWSGFLKLKPGATGALGGRGLMGSCADDGPGRADVASKVDIDFGGMRDEAGNKAAERWDRAAAARDGQVWNTWQHVRDVLHKGDIDAARNAYRDQPAMQAVLKALDDPWDGVDEYLTPREQYVQHARDGATVLYAVLKDGKWLAKGDMGWFGMSRDHQSQSDWNRKVNEMLDALPDDTTVTVVDCHI